ncbi:MAG: extracellular solute-binding protein [Acidilobus sp.]
MRAGVGKGVLSAVIIIVVVVAVIGGYLAYTYASRGPSKVKLVVATYNGINTVLELAAQEFEKEHPNVEVQVVSFPWSDYVENELTVLKAGSSSYDVITFTPTSSQLFFPYVVPINTSYVNLSDVLWGQEAFGGISYVNGKPEVMGLAIQTWVELLVYNATLFNNATLQAEFEQETGYPLNPWNWTNWQEVVAASRFFVEHHLTKYGFIVDDNPGHGLIDTYPAIFWWYWYRNSTISCNTTTGLPGYGTMFWGCIPSWWSHGFPPPAFNTSAGLEALEVLDELVKYEPPPSEVIIDYTMTGTLLSQGGVAGAVAWANDVASLPTNVSSQFLMAPLPGGYGEPGSTFLAVSKFSKHKQLAMEFIAFVLSPQFQEQAFYLQGSIPVSKEAISEIMSNASVPAYVREWLRAIMVAGENSYATPPTVPQTYAYLIPYFNQEVFSYLTGKITDPWQALQTAANEWVAALESSSTSS